MSEAYDYYDHPIFDDVNFFVHTRALEQFHERVHRWLWQGSTGAVVLGEARIGKTTALEWIADKMYLRNKQRVPTHVFSCKKRDQNTIRSVYANLCDSAQIYHVKRDPSDILMRLFVGYLLDRIAESGCDRLILFVDEMQRLSAQQMEVFAELYDELKNVHKVHLMVVFMGNKQDSTPLMKSFESRSKTHLSGRFMNQTMLYEGITDEASLHYCLNQYDRLHYPEDGPSYTGFFLPKEVQSGWRLASLSPMLWQCFKVYSRDYGITSWGMKYVTETLALLLSDLLPTHGVANVTPELINAAIDESNLIPSRIHFE